MRAQDRAIWSRQKWTLISRQSPHSPYYKSLPISRLGLTPLPCQHQYTGLTANESIWCWKLRGWTFRRTGTIVWEREARYPFYRVSASDRSLAYIVVWRFTLLAGCNIKKLLWQSRGRILRTWCWFLIALVPPYCKSIVSKKQNGP